MSDVETEDVPSALGGAIDIHTALQEVLKKALIHNGLIRGLHEVAKALEKRKAQLCVLSENCDEPMYKKLVLALCNEHQIPCITVDDNKKLGEWAGLCKIDSSGKARKVVGCSSICVTNWGDETPALDALRDHLKTIGIM